MARGRGAQRGDGGSRRYPRTARVDELCREIVADELERIDDERIPFVTVTHVHVDPDLRRAVVEVTSLDDEEDVVEALAEHRIRLQAAIGRQARLKRTPELRFTIDAVVRQGERIDAILRDMDELPGADGAGGGGSAADAGDGGDADGVQGA